MHFIAHRQVPCGFQVFTTSYFWFALVFLGVLGDLVVKNFSLRSQLLSGKSFFS